MEKKIKGGKFTRKQNIVRIARKKFLTKLSWIMGLIILMAITLSLL